MKITRQPPVFTPIFITMESADEAEFLRAVFFDAFRYTTPNPNPKVVSNMDKYHAAAKKFAGDAASCEIRISTHADFFLFDDVLNIVLRRESDRNRAYRISLVRYRFQECAKSAGDYVGYAALHFEPKKTT